MSKRVAVILSGCGVQDGAEIHEATLTLLALARAGATPVVAAPDIPQAEVVNHAFGAPQAGERRSVLAESARIARGQIVPLGQLQLGKIDAAVFPGGFGVVKNLCDFASKGPACEVNSDVARLIRSCHEAGKPMGFICIAPVLAARVLGQGQLRVHLTVGQDREVARAIEAMGAVHVACTVENVVVDEVNRVLSTPAYMLAHTIVEAQHGIDKLVTGLLARCQQAKPVVAVGSSG